MSSEPAEKTQGDLRTLNLNIVFASISAIGALLISSNAKAPEEVLLLALGLVAALVAARRWTAGRLSPVALSCCLAVTAAVWLLGALVSDNPSASFGLSVVGTIVVLQLPRHRRLTATLGLVAFLAAVIAVRSAMSPEEILGVLLGYAVGSTSVAVVGVVFAFLSHLVSGLIEELAESREREAELAVARERVRFASDLHDIQGHTLHVVKLKTALARKLVRADTERAEEELREIHALVGDTITQTKELAYAQRRLNLPAELENAKNLLKAAGIGVRVVREGEVDDHAGELLGQVLRETTTNILRHARAGQVRIALSEFGITIVNDGAGEAPSEFRGLSTLRERVADKGGELTVEQKDGRFLTAAVLPRPGSETASPSTEGRS